MQTTYSLMNALQLLLSPPSLPPLKLITYTLSAADFKLFIQVSKLVSLGLYAQMLNGSQESTRMMVLIL